jgi:hypothetical protein
VPRVAARDDARDVGSRPGSGVGGDRHRAPVRYDDEGVGQQAERHEAGASDAAVRGQEGHDEDRGGQQTERVHGSADDHTRELRGERQDQQSAVPQPEPAEALQAAAGQSPCDQSAEQADHDEGHAASVAAGRLFSPEPTRSAAPVFDTVLVADRGVCALRVVRVCERLGVQAVAVHDDDDVRSPHVREADDAVPLGGRGSAETYGDRRKVLEAARRTGAQAVHPAAGVLALDADFAQEVLDAGLVWLGPPPDVLRRPPAPAPEGGRLLTVVLDGADVVGVRSVLGAAVPVLDEAPAVGLSDDDARRVADAAVRYAAAGSGLHAVDVNLRESEATALGPAALAAPGHVATQAVTGVDLVAAQLRAAAGDRAKRPDRDRAGHAVALHLRAAELFAGRLRRFRMPSHAHADAAVAEGDRLTAQSGRLLAVLTVRGADRAEALTRARAAVDAVEVAGVPTNLPLLRRLLDDPSFVAGAPDDALLERIRR